MYSIEDKIKNVEQNLFEKSGNLINAAVSSSYGKDDIFVRSCSPTILTKGTNIMSCNATRLALDPPHRKNRCSFCAKKMEEMCGKCQMIGICPACKAEKAHVQDHQLECSALQALHEAFGCDIESSHLLTVRLLCCESNQEWWKLFLCLYELALPQDVDVVVDAVCSHLPASFCSNTKVDVLYKQIYARVLGCSHAITDVSLPLGKQYLGRALFLQHSFFNHSCTPNAFLSCCLPSSSGERNGKSDQMTNSYKQSAPPSLVARVHLLKDIQEGERITLSYIPLSGWGIQERRSKLLASYGFQCNCEACSAPTALLQLPNDVDLDSIREIQYDCNERLLLEASKNKQDFDGDHEIENIISTVQMTRRGIQNQGIPSCHEVSIEVERLLAMAFSLLRDDRRMESMEYHKEFFVKVNKLESLFDPVAKATQHLEYSRILSRSTDNDSIVNGELKKAIRLLEISIGKDHAWTQMLSSKEGKTSGLSTSYSTSSSMLPANKRVKLTNDQGVNKK